MMLHKQMSSKTLSESKENRQSDSNSQDSGNSKKKDLIKAQDTEDNSQDSPKRLQTGILTFRVLKIVTVLKTRNQRKYQ